MRISHVKNASVREKADCLVIPYWKDEKTIPAIEQKELPLFLKEIALDDFKGESEESMWIYPAGEKEKRFLLLGLGKRNNTSLENLRRCFSAAIKKAQEVGGKRVNILLPVKHKIKDNLFLRSILEGVFLANYAFNRWKCESLKKRSFSLVEEVVFIGADRKLLQKESSEISAIADGVYLARDLVNENADIVTPQKLAEVAKSLQNRKIKVDIFDKRSIEKEGMGLLLAVNKGSNKDPVFAIASYKGKPSSKEHIVLVGKGITFDSGGLNLKPTGGIETMKSDMAGAASVLATIQVISKLNLKINVTGVIAATENSIGPNSYKPGDVFKSYSDKTVEVVNTDAEGRLILADALAYVVDKLTPTLIIDIATLTGGVIIALGEEVAGFLANDEKLADRLQKASDATGESIWRLPLYSRYKEMLKSDIADLKNSGGKRSASAIMGALFLQEFVNDIPWAHIDIGGASFFSIPTGYYTTHATGFGVRLFIELLKAHE